jgi:hypothetical protein
MKLTKKDQELFEQCRMHCSVCFYDGGCALQKKYKKAVEKKMRGNK